MQRIRNLVFVVSCCLAFGWAVSELATPSFRANCAECGDGPKDKKCPDGYKCVDSKCVKK